MYNLLAMLQYITDDHHPLHNIYALILPLIWGQQQLIDCELEHIFIGFSHRSPVKEGKRMFTEITFHI